MKILKWVLAIVAVIAAALIISSAYEQKAAAEEVATQEARIVALEKEAAGLKKSLAQEIATTAKLKKTVKDQGRKLYRMNKILKRHLYPPKPKGCGAYKPGRAYTKAELFCLATKAGWPRHLLPKLDSVVKCESGRRWWARSASGTYLGLMQHNKANGGLYEKLMDPLTNLRQGWKMHQQRGWQPWSCA